MASKPTGTKPKQQTSPSVEDTAMLSLSRADRKKLNMDSWEPSLLRKLLTAQNLLKKRD
jgi:hypothetical protein